MLGMQTDAFAAAPGRETVFFDRRELDAILRVYGRMVAQNEWRDYGIERGRDHVSFAVYERAAQQPLYRIEKRPALAQRQGEWAVVGQGGHVLKRGRELEAVLRFFDKKRFSVVE